MRLVRNEPDEVMTVLLRCSIAVVGGVGQVVGEERVVSGLVLRILAVDRAFLADDLLDVLHEPVELGVGAGVVQARSGTFARRP